MRSTPTPPELLRKARDSVPSERLEACLRDLVSLLALPSLWNGRGPADILASALEAIPRLVPMDLAYARLSSPRGERGPDALFLPGERPAGVLDEVRARLAPYLDGPASLERLEGLPGLAPLRVLAFPLGFYGSGGQVLFASSRDGFPDAADTVLLRTAASLLATSLESARHVQEVEAARARAAFLSEASKLLTSSLETQSVLATLTRLAVPSLGDWCAVDMLGPDNRVERLAVFHQDPLRVRAAVEFRRRHPITLDDPGAVGKVLRTGEPELLQAPADALADEAGASPGWRWMAGQLGLSSYLSVPLTTRGQVIGALTLAYGESGRHYTQADLSTVEELARRAATSLDNARLYREAQEAVLLRDNFLSVASHELNTPITSIKLHVQGLQRTLRRLSPEVLGEAGVDAKFQTVDRQLSRLSGLVRELLDISRLTAGHLHLEPEELELTGLVREVMSRVHEDARRAGSTLLLEAPEALVGCWDRQRLDQVVTNLLSNAIKYGQGKPIRLTLRGAGDDARVVVADEGIGIAPEDQGRLFQRFERLVSHRHYSGWGLGLWIVKQLLDSMGGTIEVRSQLGHGTEFTVLLPRSAQVRGETLAG